MKLSNLDDNPILLTDAYNCSHFLLKKNTDWEISLLYNRTKPMILYGFNEIVTDLLSTKIEYSHVMEAEEYAQRMGMPFPSDMWYRVVNEFGGNIPLHVESLREGTYCPKGTPFAKVKNTVEDFGELVTWWEGRMLHTSFPSGCATEAFNISNYLKENKLPLNRVHSFGFRGHNSLENAYWTGKAWSLFFDSTDDFHMTQHVHNKLTSIPATAHKTIQQFDDEMESYYYSIDETSKAGYKALSLVIDTYDPLRFIKHYSIILAEYAQSKGIKLIFRPDSGDVKEQAFLLYVKMSANNLLENTGCIIGESMNSSKVIKYDNYFKEMDCNLKWFSYGIGSGLYKYIDRDYLGFAMKTSYSNGENRMKFSADHIKQSLPGDIFLKYENNNLIAHYDKRYSVYNTVYKYNASMDRHMVDRVSDEQIKNYIEIQKTNRSLIISKEISDEEDRLRQKYVKNEPSIIV